MKVLTHTENMAVIRLSNKRILKVTDEGVSLTFEQGNGHKTKNFGFDDMIRLNDAICAIMKDVIDERNYLRQHNIINITPENVEIVVEPNCKCQHVDVEVPDNF